jgi:hypothetical protein
MKRYHYCGYSPVQVAYDVVTLRREGYHAYEEIYETQHYLMTNAPASFLYLLAGNGLIYRTDAY